MNSRNTNIRGQNVPCTFFSELYSAASEWALIILLLANAVLAYIATKFARFMNLRIPCVLCSRLDDILGNDQKGFYKDLLCHGHKIEISELGYCQKHRKLGNAKEMCEACLLSSILQKKYGPEAYKLLIEKLGLLEPVEGQDNLAKEPSLSKEIKSDSEGTELCSCCSQVLTKKPFSSLLLQAKESTAEVSTKLPRREGLGKKKKKNSVSKMDSEQLSHVGYRKLKISSDVESELPRSDDDSSTKAVRQAPVKLPVSSNADKGMSFSGADDVVKEKTIHPDPVVQEISAEVQETKLEPAQDSKHENNLVPESTSAIGHGLEEINWDQIVVPARNVEATETTTQQVPKEVSNEQPMVVQVGEILCGPVVSQSDITKGSASNDLSQSAGRIMGLNDSLKGAFPNKGNVSSPRFSEILAGKEYSKVHEDLKTRLSQRSPYQVLDTPLNDIGSPKQLSEVKSSEASSSTGLPSVNKRLSYERTNSGFESGEASLFTEIEAEWSIERLRQQIDMDRKSMTALYKELDDERSASEVAVNESMAMINRLQEEKAAMQMEALQYLRMMEEQSEYDQEAIQKLNDLLTEREKELLDLEAELDSYRMRYGEESIEEKVIEPLKTSEITRSNSISSNNLTRSLSRSKSEKSILVRMNSSGSFKMDEPFLDFKEERAYIEGYLKSLQQKLNASGTDGFSTEGKIDKKQSYKVDTNGHLSETGEERNNSESSNFARTTANGPSLTSEQSGLSTVPEDHEISCNAIDHQYGFRKKGNIVSLQDEVEMLNERLKAFEADRKFLDMTISTLRSGDDGLRYVQDIASQLRELRIFQAAQAE